MVALQIRNVPEEVRKTLAERARGRGQSLQAYLLEKGAPPGYVGYGEGGVLTEAVRRKPYSVVLLDEIEKAHPDIHEIFFQVFDKGWMEDGEGRYIDFKNTIILLTSNVGTELIMDMDKDGVRADAEAIKTALKEANSQTSFGLFDPLGQLRQKGGALNQWPRSLSARNEQYAVGGQRGKGVCFYGKALLAAHRPAGLRDVVQHRVGAVIEQFHRPNQIQRFVVLKQQAINICGCCVLRRMHGISLH